METPLCFHGPTQGLQSWEWETSCTFSAQWALRSPTHLTAACLAPPVSHVFPDLIGALITIRAAQAQPPFLPLMVLQDKELLHRTLCRCRTSPAILGTSPGHLMSSQTGRVPAVLRYRSDQPPRQAGAAHRQRKGCSAAGPVALLRHSSILSSPFPLGRNQAREAGQAGRALLCCIFQFTGEAGEARISSKGKIMRRNNLETQGTATGLVVNSNREAAGDPVPQLPSLQNKHRCCCPNFTDMSL